MIFNANTTYLGNTAQGHKPSLKALCKFQFKQHKCSEEHYIHVSDLNLAFGQPGKR